MPLYGIWLQNCGIELLSNNLKSIIIVQADSNMETHKGTF